MVGKTIINLSEEQNLPSFKPLPAMNPNEIVG
jgi:hypothetical protein